jgi:hypothetical protein
MKADQADVVFGDRSREIVVGNFTRHAAHSGKGMNVATGERFEALAMSELNSIQLGASTSAKA